MNVKRVLQKVVELKASDLHVKVGTKPIARVNGALVVIDEPAPSQADLETVVDQILTPKQKRIFEETKEVDFAFAFSRWRPSAPWHSNNSGRRRAHLNGGQISTRSSSPR